MSVIDQINKLLGKNASSAQAPTDAPLAAEVSGDQDRADDRMPAAESGQFSRADFPDSKMALGAAMGGVCYLYLGHSPIAACVRSQPHGKRQVHTSNSGYR